VPPTTAAGVPDPLPAVEQPGYGVTTSSPDAFPERRVTTIATAALAVVAVIGVVVGVIYLMPRRADISSVPAGSSRVDAPAPATAGSPAPRTTPAPVSPRVALDALVDSDRVTAERLVGSWVPQISSKEVGTVVDGRTYDEAAILADIRTAKARHPQAVVVRSDTYTSFRRPGFWVTLVATPFPSPDGALSWCDTNGLGPDDCFAKRLSHSDGPTGNTVLR
jgi:serine/threonine-protein kinase